MLTFETREFMFGLLRICLLVSGVVLLLYLQVAASVCSLYRSRVAESGGIGVARRIAPPDARRGTGEYRSNAHIRIARA